MKKYKEIAKPCPNFGGMTIWRIYEDGTEKCQC